MAYPLTLTAGERDAIDWVGNRYPTGDNLRRTLCRTVYGDIAWDEPGDVTFDVPEHAAWYVNELCEEATDGWRTSFPCFGRELSPKLRDFCDAIV